MGTQLSSGPFSTSHLSQACIQHSGVTLPPPCFQTYSRQAVFTEFQNISAVYTGDLIVLSLWFAVLVALYEEPEKPTSALDFLKHHLGAATPENPEIELLRLELAEMKEKYEATVEENKKLKAKLVQYEPPQEEKRAE